MGDRRQSRELALCFLFFFDAAKADQKEDLIEFCSLNKEKLTKHIKPFFLKIVKGVIDDSEKIDSLLKKHSKHWKISRMPIVDRNIMRIAVFEFLKCSDIPSCVSINEAIEIGKKYGTKDSGSFINGVLDQVKQFSEI